MGRKAFAVSVTPRAFCGLRQCPTGKSKGVNIGDNNSIKRPRMAINVGLEVAVEMEGKARGPFCDLPG